MENINKVDYFLLSGEWAEPEAYSRICYSIRTSFKSKEEHDEFVEKTKQKLLNENDTNYTSWVHTYTSYGNIGGIQPYCSVLHFRVRDTSG